MRDRLIFSVRQTVTDITRPHHLLLSMAFLFLWLFANLNLASIIVSLFITYRAIDRILSPQIFDSKLFKIVLTPFFYALVLQSVVMVSWIINHDFPLDLVAFLTLGVVVALSFISMLVGKNPKHAPSKSERTPWLRASDFVACLAALMMLCILVLAPMLHSGVHLRSSVLGVITGGVDDSAHLGMINDHIQFNRGVFYRSDASTTLRNVGAVSGYPAGWHSVNSTVIQAANPSISTGTQTLEAYALSKIFWHLVLTFVFVKAIFTFYAILARRRLTLPVGIWIGSASLFFGYLFLLDSFLEGFYTFVPQLVVMLLLALLLMQLSSIVRTTKASISAQGTVALIALVCIAGSLSWLLVFPAVVLSVMFSFIERGHAMQAKPFFKELFGGILRYLPFYSLLLLSFLVQLYISSSPESNVRFSEAILYSGGVGIYSEAFYAILFVGMALGLSLFKRQVCDQQQAVLNILIATAALAAFIYIFQQLQIDRTQYYYYKVLGTFTIVALPFAIAGFGMALNVIHITKSARTALAAALLLPILILQFVGVNAASNPIELPTFAYAKGVRQSTPTINESIYSELRSESSEKNYYNKNLTIYFEPEHLVQNYFSTMLVKSNKPASTCFDATLSALLSDTDDLTAIQNAVQISCTHDRHIEILTDSSHVAEFRNSVAAAGLNGRMVVASFEK